MRRLMAAVAQEEQVSIGRILQVFGVRGFAFLLLLLALLNIFIFMVPMISVLFGLPMVILAAQMVLGFRAPIFPVAVRHRTIRRDALVRGLETGVVWVGKLERFIKPRFLFLSVRQLDRVHGLLALMLAVMVALPIPVVNVPPSVGLVFLAIGMLEKDGVFIALAYAIAIWCLFLFKSLGYAAHTLAA
ncbi:MAG: exopolysaccharide biosynthesis protein [Alphaproteobacteria bacterium]|nr:exopolysaccharide biosynthesis protein [Alphaproteobacteria bacterium]